MNASLLQIIFLVLSIFTVIALTIYVYSWAVKKDKIWFYVYTMMLIILVQWMSDTGAALFFQSYFFHLASTILFPSVFFCLFIVYVTRGVKDTFQMLCLLISGEIGYVLTVGMLALLGNAPPYLSLDYSWLLNHFFSTLAVVADYYILILVWPIIHNKSFKIPIFIKTGTIFFAIFCVDTIIFTFGAFWNAPMLFQILKSNILVRFFLSVLITPVVTYYLNLISRNSNGLNYLKWGESVTTEEFKAEIKKSTEQIDSLQKIQEELTLKSLDYDNQRKAILNILEDVQKEKVKYEQLNTRFILATRSANIGILEMNLKNGTMHGNVVCCKLYGLPKNGLDLSFEDWQKKVHPEDLPEVLEKVNLSVKGGALFDHSFRIVLPNGAYRYIQGHAQTELDSNGHPIKMIGVNWDITQDKEVDKAKSEFISLASHQLRTPLSTINWYLEMLLNGDAGAINNEQKKFLEEAYGGSKRMVSLVNSLLNVSRIEAGTYMVDPVPTDVVTLVKNVVADLKPKLDSKKINFVVESSNIPTILLDQNLAILIIQNLLTNAAKYTNVNGNILFSISVKSDTNELLIRIKDDGIGISEEERDKIFKKMYRAENAQKSSEEGTGLGLYMVKELVERSKGKVWFDSEINKGSTFYVTIPLSGMIAKEGTKRLS